MKSLTEFPTFKLTQGMDAKKALAAEGKSPEEITAGLGEKFKLEGEKLKYFENAIEVASQNAEKLSRVLVVTLQEGETLPPKATKVDEQYYVPEFQKDPKSIEEQKSFRAGKGGGGKQKSKGPKPSPWGISPEEKEAKKEAARAAARAASQNKA